jgi:hypothetical protein
LSHKENPKNRAKFKPEDTDTLIRVMEGFVTDLQTYLIHLKNSQQK